MMDLAEAKEIWDKKYPRPGLSAKGSEAIDWLIREAERLSERSPKWKSGEPVNLAAAAADAYKWLKLIDHNVSVGKWTALSEADRQALDGCMAAMWSELKKGEDSRDGSLSLAEAINGVLGLYPGADRQALVCLGELLVKRSA